jgi:hypothetical protein
VPSRHGETGNFKSPPALGANPLALPLQLREGRRILNQLQGKPKTLDQGPQGRRRHPRPSIREHLAGVSVAKSADRIDRLKGNVQFILPVAQGPHEFDLIADGLSHRIGHRCAEQITCRADEHSLARITIYFCPVAARLQFAGKIWSSKFR